jgi:hypothetical protein
MMIRYELGVGCICNALGTGGQGHGTVSQICRQ